MKRKSSALLTIIGLMIISGIHCNDNEKCSVYEPVFLSFQELRESVAVEAPRSLENTGKIYIKDDYIFVNSRKEGIHIIDNSDPALPEPIAFINIPGNIDISVSGSYLYADSYTDLVVIDISDPVNSSEIRRVENVFDNSYFSFNDREDYDFNGIYKYDGIDASLGIVTGWKKTGTENCWSDNEEFGCGISTSSGEYASTVAMESSAGRGGSMARFTIAAGYLYTLNGSKMQLFTITDPSAPALWASVEVAWDIETIFPYGNYILIGSQTGMYIYDNTDPSNPVRLSVFSHATSCDPVVAEGTTAYVTLRGGNMCGGVDNQLDIIDISNPLEPVLIKSWIMQEPYGLAVEGNLLFIADGPAGMKVYDCTDPLALSLIAHKSGHHGYDIILNNKVAILIGPEGLYQYDYSSVDNIILLSAIYVSR